MEGVLRLRLAVAERAAGHCEACGREHRNQAEFDHWLGGNGRRRELESVETVWLLCLPCHRDRTDNRPHPGAWNEIFRAHCERYGYPFVPHQDLRALLKEGGIG